MTGTGPDESSLTLLNFRSKDAIYFFTGSIFDFAFGPAAANRYFEVNMVFTVSIHSSFHVINFSDVVNRFITAIL